MKKVATFLCSLLTALALISVLHPPQFVSASSVVAPWLLQGGNIFGEDVSVGSLDSFNLLFITNETEKMRLTAAGGLHLGGVTDPGVGNFKATGLTHVFGTLDTGFTRATVQGNSPIFNVLSSVTGTPTIDLDRTGWGPTVASWSADDNAVYFEYTGNGLIFHSSIGGGSVLQFDNLGGIRGFGTLYIFGTAGTPVTLTVGQGTTGTDVGKIVARSGNNTTTAPVIALNRNNVDIAQFTFNGTDTFLDYTGAINWRSGIAGTTRMSLTSGGNLDVVGNSHLFGTTGTTVALQVGRGTTGSDQGIIRARNGTGTSGPIIALNRNGTDISQWITDGVDTFLDQTGALKFRTGIAGTAYASLAAATDTWGVAGTAITFTIGQGAAGTDASTLRIRSANTTTTTANIFLNRNGTDFTQWKYDGTATYFDYDGNLVLRSGINGTTEGTLTPGGNLSIVGFSHTFGTAGTAITFTIGQGTTGTDASTLEVRSGNSGTTAPSIMLDRNGTDFSQWTYNGTDTFFDYAGTLTWRSGIAGSTFMTLTTAGFLTNVGHHLLDNTGTASELRLREPSAGGSEYSSFKSVAMGANANYSLPPDDGNVDDLLRTDGSGVLTWVAPGSGSGDVTAVGPGCATGQCFTNGLATTGSILLVWEGTTINGTDFTINVPTDPNFSIAWTVPNAGADLTFPSGTDTIVARDSTDTLTGKTLNVESTGNILTTVEKLWIPAASCANTVATANWDTTSNSQPNPSCVTGTNTQKGVLLFDDTTDEAVQTHIRLPTDWTGNIDAVIKWTGVATTNAVGWCIQLVCVADGETDDPAFPAQAAANCVSDTAKGTTLQTNDATITNITQTGCAAGELMHVRWSRDANGGAVTDSFVGDASGIGVELTLRRAQ